MDIRRNGPQEERVPVPTAQYRAGGEKAHLEQQGYTWIVLYLSCELYLCIVLSPLCLSYRVNLYYRLFKVYYRMHIKQSLGFKTIHVFKLDILRNE